MKYLFLFILCLNFIEAHSQKEDRVWVFGEHTGIDFSDLQNPVTISDSEIYMVELFACISDTGGHLWIYTNGMPLDTFSNFQNVGAVFNSQHQLIENGDSLKFNFTVTNGALFIPYLLDEGQYYLFHTGGNPRSLYYSIVDMNMNAGLGKVTQKNVLMLSDLMSEKLTAIKHANGRDWWLISHTSLGNNYTEFLVDIYGIHGPYYFPIGSNFNSTDFAGEICFDKNGNKLVVAGLIGLLDVLSFDRCSGTLSNFQILGDSASVYYGCSFSPNGNVLYVSTEKKLFNFDLTASDILATKTQIWSVSGNSRFFGQHELGPDNKIYVSVSKYYDPLDSTNTHLSVINDPNNFSSCNLTPYSFSLNGNRMLMGLPNMPNYNLGKIPDSPCDTVNATIELSDKKNVVRIYPNPSHDAITIEILNGIKPKSISILDALGREIIKVNATKPIVQVNIKALNEGLYFVKAQQPNGSVQIQKFIKQ